MRIAGNLDLCGPELIEGWLYNEEWGEPLRLQVYIGDQLIGECVTDRFRQDLLEAGHGDGRCGFSFRVPANTAVDDFAAARVRLLDTPLYLLPTEFTRIANEPKEPESAETHAAPGTASPAIPQPRSRFAALVGDGKW